MKRQIVRYICNETGQDAQNALRAENDQIDNVLNDVSVLLSLYYFGHSYLHQLTAGWTLKSGDGCSKCKS